MSAKKEAPDLGAVSVQLGDVRKNMHLALSELSVDIQQHGTLRDATKEKLNDVKKQFDELVKNVGGAEAAEPVDQNQPTPGQASVPDVPSQP